MAPDCTAVKELGVRPHRGDRRHLVLAGVGPSVHPGGNEI
jgi:hypothetical protein